MPPKKQSNFKGKGRTLAGASPASPVPSKARKRPKEDSDEESPDEEDVAEDALTLLNEDVAGKKNSKTDEAGEDSAEEVADEYEIEGEDGTMTVFKVDVKVDVNAQGAGDNIDPALRKRMDTIKADERFKTNIIRGRIMQIAVLNRAKSTAAQQDDNILSWSQESVKAPKGKVFLQERTNGIWIKKDKEVGGQGRPKLRRMTEEELAEHGLTNDCRCETCTKQAAWSNYYHGRVREDADKLRSGKKFKQDEGHVLG